MVTSRSTTTRWRRKSDSRPRPSRDRRISASSIRCANACGADAWFETGCISAHYRNRGLCRRGRASRRLKAERPQSQVAIRMVKRDGTEVLQGTASVGRDNSATALDKRLRDELKPLTDPVILRDVKVGMKTRRQIVRMDFDQTMGELYPFLAARQAQRHHRAVPALPAGPRRGQQMAPRHHPVRDAECAVSISLAAKIGIGADQGTGSRLVRRSGNPAARRAAVRRRKLRARFAKWSRSAAAGGPRACGCVQ